MRSLPIPPIAEASPRAADVLRLWIVEGEGQHISLRHDVWEDPAAWGLMLVDIARHVARARAQAGDVEKEVFQRVLAGFYAEVDSPTDEGKGDIA